MKYWKTRDGRKSQAGPYGEPPYGAITDRHGFAIEFEECDCELTNALEDLARAYRYLGGLDHVHDAALLRAEHALSKARGES